MFIWIQVLRGVAAAMVVCHHYVAAQVEHGAEGWPALLQFGGAGADIFFVISGFIMMMTQSAQAGPSSARIFLWRRLMRIAPLYWALTALAFGVATLAASEVNTDYSAMKFTFSMLFMPYNEYPVDMSAEAYHAYVLPIAWTLTYEWLFYLAFAVALALGLQPAMRLGFIVSCFAACVFVGTVFSPAMPLLQMLSSPLLFEFLLGCIVAVLYQRRVRLGVWQSVLAALVAMTFLSSIVHESDAGRVLVWGGASLALVAAAALNSRARAAPSLMLRPFARLGDISYSLYLSHFFTLALFVRLQEKLPALRDGFGIASILAFFLLAWNISALCYRFIEEPSRVFFAQRKNAMGVAG